MFPIHDMFDAFLIGGFLFGVLFTVITILLGFGDIGADHGHDFDHGADHGGESGHGAELLNVSSIVAFITWFCGVTYLVRNGLGWFVWIAILLGLVFGLAGAWLIAWFLYSILLKNSPELNPADWDTVGQIGEVTSTIRQGGIGEMIYERHGSRHAIPARSKSGVGIDRATEVVILDIVKGVAIVQPWAELMDEVRLEGE